MSVLIKGMEMPTRCSECPLETYDEDYYGYESNYNCPLIYKGYTEKNRDASRRNDCPLVEVPPHGDLIDREKALVLVKDVCDAILSFCDSHYDEEIGDEVYSDIREVAAILKCNKEIRIAIKNIPSVEAEALEFICEAPTIIEAENNFKGE